MTPEMVELARRAVACKGWRWMAGMRRVWPFLVREPISQGTVWSCLASGEDRARGYIERMPSERVEDDPLSLEPSEKWDDATDQWMADIPDLTDPATLGCLLALVREAWGDPSIIAEPSLGMWEISRSDGCGLRTSGVWGGGGRGRGGRWRP